ncbi:MAG: flagellar M-ring protein FliF [Lachnospiraceae bacterium]|nr:flagellar M-ring protein FliF [Lachnospiraceae bacterium]MBR4993885.1 flagellar M-ring protein FliF [Lachnospiraceae bacterium]
MVEKLKELWQKVVDWWNKFTSKQKTIIVGVAAAVILAFAILVMVLSQPVYTQLMVCSDTAEASKITELLSGQSITYQTSTDGLVISVLEEQYSEARLALGAAGIPTQGMSIDDVTSGGLSTTESDKQKRYVKYKQDELKSIIEIMDSVDSAKVELSIPEQDGTLIASTQEASCAIFLVLKGDFTEDMAAYIARFAATSLGNTTTNNITIIDSNGKLWFSGDSEISVGGVASSQLDARQKQENVLINSVKRVLLGTGQFNSVEVACNLDIDFSKTTKQTQTYDAPDGRTEGMLSEETIYNSESTGSNGGVPGTTSNDSDTTSYQYSDVASESATESEEYRKYLPNSYTTVSEVPAGVINYSNSSATITAINYNVINEVDTRNQGLLDGITWDEYKAANSEAIKLTVDDEFYSAVATATGMPKESITIMAYQINEFMDEEDTGMSAGDILSIILIVLILGLLGFVVFRSMVSKEAPQETEELSVEDLLQSTPEADLSDIEVETKSETRKMIEKFVDENPEAAANLLRNWLNEEWG